MKNKGFVVIGSGVLLLSALMAVGATQISGVSGYAGAGPNTLPWVVSAALALLGILLILSARRASEPLVEAPGDAPHWPAMAWVSVGLVLNALLLEHVGFIPSCALLFALAARGFRVGAGRPPTLIMSVRDFGLGVLISAPVFWMFTKVLGVSLPSLVPRGWI
jgi:putative tricarboxylic transport membrane protein